MRFLFYMKIILISFLIYSVSYAQKENAQSGIQNKTDKNWQRENENVQNKINLNQSKMPIFSINIANEEK